jgi:hypothetical protein
MASSSSRALLDQLLGEDLSGVTFVRDYLQLQFNPPPTINVYSTCRVMTPAGTSSFGEQGFPNQIISLIDQPVVSVAEADEVLAISFANGARIEIPFDEKSFDGPEAFEFLGKKDKWGVWP